MQEATTVATMSGKDESLEPEVQIVPDPNHILSDPPIISEDELPDPQPEDTLWDGGPTFAMINQWKSEYGNENIYVTSVNPTKHVVWRTISRFEYRAIVKQLEEAVNTGALTQAEANMNNEELITNVCILYPKYGKDELSKDMAGIASLLSQEILEASAFVALDIRRL